MARRLYHIGLSYEIHGSKNAGTSESSFPMSLQHVGLVQPRFGQPYRVIHHLSSTSATSTYRNENNSSLHIQSMKKSAFKMLCKFIVFYRKKRNSSLEL